MDRIAAAIRVTVIIVFAAGSTGPAQSSPLVSAADASVQPAGLMARCPCTTDTTDSLFASFVEGERQLLTCTDDTPTSNFVRLVATNFDLVVLFEFPPQLYCGSQRTGNYTHALPVTTAQFRACERLFVQAAGDQGLRCSPE
jgi:hypothetical protein